MMKWHFLALTNNYANMNIVGQSLNFDFQNAYVFTARRVGGGASLWRERTNARKRIMCQFFYYLSF